jgi:microcystin-dependent protein
VLNPSCAPVVRVAALFAAIGFAWGGDRKGKFNLPDLQGFFLRGVDPTRGDHQVDRDSDTRGSRHTGGNKGARVGSYQGYATAVPPQQLGQPDTSFRTNVAGEHTHSLDFQLDAGRDVDNQDNTVAYPGRPATDEPVRPAGAHAHVITGGDKETRPANAYVHWIIRYRISP